MLFSRQSSDHPFPIIFLFQLISAIHQPFGFRRQVKMVVLVGLALEDSPMTFPSFFRLEQLVLKEVQIAAVAVQMVEAIVETGQAGTGEGGPAHLLQVAVVIAVVIGALAGSAG